MGFEDFAQALADAKQVYDYHAIKKGDGWKDCSIKFLFGKLTEEYEEFMESTPKSEEEYREVLDIVNVALMLAARLRKPLPFDLSSSLSPSPGEAQSKG